VRDHGEIYRALSARYGFSPQVIAGMTPAQQEMYLHDGKADPTTGHSIVTLPTMQEAREYLASLGR
jgi:hypothetical protein